MPRTLLNIALEGQTKQCGHRTPPSSPHRFFSVGNRAGTRGGFPGTLAGTPMEAEAPPIAVLGVNRIGMERRLGDAPGYECSFASTPSRGAEHWREDPPEP